MKYEIRQMKSTSPCAALRFPFAPFARKFFSSLVAILFINISLVNAQVVLNEKEILSNLKKHVSLLASDSLQGRETGTKGETMAAEYIISEYKKIGLIPMGDKGKFTESFSFSDGVKYGSKNSLNVQTKIQSAPIKKMLDTDFYPLAYSSNGKTKGEMVFVGYGISAPALNLNDYSNLSDLKGKVFVMELSSPEGNNPHSKYAAYSDIRQKLDTAISKGAAAVIFINSDTSVANPEKNNFHMKITPSSVPVIFYTKEKSSLQLDMNPAIAEIETDLIKIEKEGKNIIGFIDNKAKTTVVIGAHYDHLGFGEEGSLHRGNREIHNGADDNASGIAAIIEIARYLKNLPSEKQHLNNYLIMAFSGEEKGLYGSASFTKNPTIKLEIVNYMINLDMVGRLDSAKRLAINGVGTSPEWTPFFNSVTIDGIKIKTSESGIGPSDHTSFYLKDIPVLHFFSGTHPDYHKPSDDEEKVNYPGMVSIMKIILTTVETMNDKGKIAFTKTKDEKSEDTPRFKVTLGVVPDYMFDGEGMRIDGITEGKPASKAGLEAGDIVVQLGEIKVTDMMSYMKALSKFQKGDEATVHVLRGKEVIQKKVQF